MPTTSSMQSQAPPGLLHHDAVRRVLWITLALNILVALTKVLYGYYANIISLQADGFHSGFDALSNIIGLVALSHALHPPDPEHPYGHKKLEVAASIAIGIMILLGFIEIGRSIISAAMDDGPSPLISPLSYKLVLGTILISLIVSFYERRAGKKYNSLILQADSEHTLADALAGLAVLAGMFLVDSGIEMGDIMAATIVMFFIGMTAYRVLSNGMSIVVDAALLDAEAVREIVEEIPDVISCHYVRSRGMPGHIHLDLHITLDPYMELHEAGQIMLRVKKKLCKYYPELEDILIQIEPHHPLHYEDVPDQLV